MNIIFIPLIFSLTSLASCALIHIDTLDFDYIVNNNFPITNFSKSIELNCSVKSTDNSKPISNVTFALEFYSKSSVISSGQCEDGFCYFIYQSSFNTINEIFNLNFKDLEYLRSNCIVKVNRDFEVISHIKVNMSTTAKVISGIL